MKSIESTASEFKLENFILVGVKTVGFKIVILVSVTVRLARAPSGRIGQRVLCSHLQFTPVYIILMYIY